MADCGAILQMRELNELLSLYLSVLTAMSRYASIGTIAKERPLLA